MVSSRRYIEAPTGTPLPFGLLSVADLEDFTDPHYALGVEYESVACGTPSATSVQACTTGYDDPLDLDEGYGLVGGDGFTVYALHHCKLVGDTTRAQDTARRKLTIGESRAVEAGFAETLVGADDLTPTPGTAVSPVAGLAMLEDYAAQHYSGTPVIHMPRGIGTILGGRWIGRQGSRLETVQGVPVASGGGYSAATGTGAVVDGTTAGANEQWMWVTGQVVIRRGPVAVSDQVVGLASPKNEGLVLASRPVVVTSECLLAAVMVAGPALAVTA